MKALYLLTVIGLALIGCKKDKPNTATSKPTPISKWEKIVGEYKVYDTLGLYLYEMRISHTDGVLDWGAHVDSLHFENLDGQFDVSAKQTFASNLPETNIRIGSHNPLVDSLNNRWVIYGMQSMSYNFWYNDTIVLQFDKNNIQYYILDTTPYSHVVCKHIAVKQ